MEIEKRSTHLSPALSESHAEEGVSVNKICLHHLFEAQVQRTPDDIAVVFEGRSLTYRELNARANQVAHYLIAQGIEVEDIVGVCVDRSLELIIGLLGILKAGAAFFPIDPECPEERVRVVMYDSGMKILLTQKNLIDQLPKVKFKYVDLMHSTEIFSSYSQVNPQSQVTEKNLAYVIYTSGSTGKPKGIMIEHKSICNLLFWLQDKYPLDSSDRVIQKISISFDASLKEFFWPLMSGAVLVIAPPGMQKDPYALMDFINREKVTVIGFAPTTLSVFLDQEIKGCESLRCVISGGEALQGGVQANFYSKLSCQLHNFYGPTETTVLSAYYDCKPEEVSGTVPIGSAVANTELYILDENCHPCAIGITGELYIGGIGLARGYLNNSELTKEKFINNPLIENASSLLYKTGDLCKYLPDGNIAYVDRCDNQVKVRGYRIELGEVESVLSRHESIKQAIVVLKGEGDEKKLVAYVVCQKKDLMNPEEVKNHLKKYLPEYMLPSVFIQMDEFPVMVTGKVNRQALPDPTPEDFSANQKNSPPQNALEIFLMNIWSKVLGLNAIDRDMDFFSIGGDSIQATKITNQLVKESKEIISVVAVFEHPTISSFSKFLMEEYPSFAKSILGAEVAENKTHTQKMLQEQDLENLRRLIKPVVVNKRIKKNPKAIFVLSPPRSGSTLFRIMLGGHTRLFAPPELTLLSYPDLKSQRTSFEKNDGYFLEGLVRTIMEIFHCDSIRSKKMLADWEKQNLSNEEVFSIIQKEIAPKILVDKSTHYALDRKVLQRAENSFEDPFYVHLLRHPCGMINSFVKANTDLAYFTHDHSYSREQLAELIWLTCHQNIREFLKDIPTSRQYQLKYEDLVNDPENVMRVFCEKVNIPFSEEMLTPYQEQEGKMTDGSQEGLNMVGDPKFHLYNNIDKSVAEQWKNEFQNKSICDLTVKFIDDFGYVRPD